MDENLKKALEYSKYMITLNNQKRVILEQYNENLNFYFNGGKFFISQQLLSFCKMLLDCNQKSVVLIDDDGVPIEIADLESFLKSILSQYSSVSNKYLAEYQKLAKQRSVQGIVSL